MTVQVKVSTQLMSGEGEGAKQAENGTVTVRVQRKVVLQVFQDGKMVESEQWQDQEYKTLANEEGMVPIHANQRVVIEEAK